MANRLDGIEWECTSCPPGLADHPDAVTALDLPWTPADVPGTAAGALRAAGQWDWGDDDEAILDGADWWWRTRVPTADSGGPWILEVGGLATIADVWLEGELIGRSENMFLPQRHELAQVAEGSELVIRCRALGPLLAERRPRPRWRAVLPRAQSHRWFRTTLMGRSSGAAAWGAPVGPWRPLVLRSTQDAAFVVERRLFSRLEGTDGVIEVTVLMAGTGSDDVSVAVGDCIATATAVAEGAAWRVTATVRIPDVDLWWPHTHGPPTRYRVELRTGAGPLELGHVGFRTINVDDSGGGYTFLVNGQPIFVRGALWVPPDPVTLNPAPGDLRASLEAARDGGVNMLRVGGYTVYESEDFWDLCDEFGILVWQDCMIAGFDPPDDPAWQAGFEAEVTHMLTSAGGHAALAIVCGSSESYQQAAMFGAAPDSWRTPLLDDRISALADRLVPGTPYLASCPIGGDLPFCPDSGVAHYFGIGAYMRPVEDARLSGLRFAGECLAFGIPPERPEVEARFGGSLGAGHDAAWKAGVPRDAGASWDFDDVREHYVRELFGVDPEQARFDDPEWALDLGRAAVCEAMQAAMTHWRRPSSGCSGALILSWADLRPGAGWGLRDHTGAPKAPWYVLRRVLAPVAVTMTDDGMSGLRVQLYNDPAAPLDATVGLEVYDLYGTVVEKADLPVYLEGRSSREVAAVDILGGFRDLNWAYRFGPNAYEAVVATLSSSRTGTVLSRYVYLVGGAARPRVSDVGLTATARRAGDGWELVLSSHRLAQYVVPELQPGCHVTDSWFHIPPGTSVSVGIRVADGVAPSGHVRALNSNGEVAAIEDTDR